VDIHQDITVTNGPKFWMLMHLNIFKKRNFHKEVATKFKENVLSKGGTEHPMTLYKRFRGQEPKPDALLKRAVIVDFEIRFKLSRNVSVFS
jgi:hypothetical protein